MAKVLGKIVFPNGTYMKDGEEKTRWLHCGVLLETDRGMRIKLDALPINMQEGWFSVFEDEKPQPGASQPAQAQKKDDVDDDIPF